MAWAIFNDDYVLWEDSFPMGDIDIHHAEMIAIKEALSWLKEISVKDCTVEIFSDSQTAIQVLNGHTARDQISLDTMSLLRDLQCSTILSWVKGHSGNIGNEYVDMLAKVSTDYARELSYTEPYLPILPQGIKRIISTASIAAWQKTWNDNTDYRVSRLFIPKIKEHKLPRNLGSYELHQLSQIITGRGLYKRLISKWTDIPDISCSLCGEADEDPWHLWEYCPALKLERASVQNQFKQGLSWFLALIKFFLYEENQRTNCLK